MSTSGYLKVLQSLSRNFRVSQGTSVSLKVLQSLPSNIRVSLGTSESLEELQSLPRYFRVSKGTSESLKELQSLKVLQSLSNYVRVSQNPFRVPCGPLWSFMVLQSATKTFDAFLSIKGCLSSESYKGPLEFYY